MMKYSEYESLADTVKIEDITSDDDSAMILRWVKEDDPDFPHLSICKWKYWRDNALDFVPEDTNDAGWLGFFVGKSNSLRSITLESDKGNVLERELIESICKGVSHNRSISSIHFRSFDLLGGEIFQLLDPFFSNNCNLTEIEIDYCFDTFYSDGHSRLSLALAGCRGLKIIELTGCGIGDEQLADIVMALHHHTKLESLVLQYNNIGRNGCMALATFINQTGTDLLTLDLDDNDIDDDGVDALIGALEQHDKLRNLHLSGNQSITARGLRAVSSLLQSPSTNLEELTLSCSGNFGDEGAVVFARALANNKKLHTFRLWDNRVTLTGWAAFTELLCDTSSIDKTFHSNHTLKDIQCPRGPGGEAPLKEPRDLSGLLQMNRDDDKKSVAIRKILKNHDDFDFGPLFEWEFNALPSVNRFFERATACVEEDEKEGVKRRKLRAIYQFVRSMPVLYVEACTGKKQITKKRRVKDI